MQHRRCLGVGQEMETREEDEGGRVGSVNVYISDTTSIYKIVTGMVAVL